MIHDDGNQVDKLFGTIHILNVNIDDVEANHGLQHAQG